MIYGHKLCIENRQLELFHAELVRLQALPSGGVSRTQSIAANQPESRMELDESSAHLPCAENAPLVPTSSSVLANPTVAAGKMPSVGSELLERALVHKFSM